MHQGTFIRAHLKERRYHLDELSELSGIPEDELNDLLKLEVLPAEALEKIAWVWVNDHGAVLRFTGRWTAFWVVLGGNVYHLQPYCMQDVCKG